MFDLLSSGEIFIADKVLATEKYKVDKFIFANIAGIDAGTVVDKEQGMPDPGDIVDIVNVTQEGKTSANQIIYSVFLDNSYGDYEFNWIGLYCSQSDVIVAVATLDIVNKLKEIPGTQVGNNVVRSYAMEFDNAAIVTNITVEAESWMLDIGPYLEKVEVRIIETNKAAFGDVFVERSAFDINDIGSGFYDIYGGWGVFKGLFYRQEGNFNFQKHATNETVVYVDVYVQGDMGGKEVALDFVVEKFGAAHPDYVDVSGVQHYLIELGRIDPAGAVTDALNLYRGDTSLSLEALTKAFWSFEIERQTKLAQNGDALFIGDAFSVEQNGGNVEIKKGDGIVKGMGVKLASDFSEPVSNDNYFYIDAWLSFPKAILQPNVIIRKEAVLLPYDVEYGGDGFAHHLVLLAKAENGVLQAVYQDKRCTQNAASALGAVNQIQYGGPTDANQKLERIKNNIVRIHVENTQSFHTNFSINFDDESTVPEDPDEVLEMSFEIRIVDGTQGGTLMWNSLRGQTLTVPPNQHVAEDIIVPGLDKNWRKISAQISDSQPNYYYLIPGFKFNQMPPGTDFTIEIRNPYVSKLGNDQYNYEDNLLVNPECSGPASASFPDRWAVETYDAIITPISILPDIDSTVVWSRNRGARLVGYIKSEAIETLVCAANDALGEPLTALSFEHTVRAGKTIICEGIISGEANTINFGLIGTMDGARLMTGSNCWNIQAIGPYESDYNTTPFTVPVRSIAENVPAGRHLFEFRGVSTSAVAAATYKLNTNYSGVDASTLEKFETTILIWEVDAV